MKIGALGTAISRRSTPYFDMSPSVELFVHSEPQLPSTHPRDYPFWGSAYDGPPGAAVA